MVSVARVLVMKMFEVRLPRSVQLNDVEAERRVEVQLVSG